MIEFAEIVRIVRRRWWLIALPPLLAAVVALPQIVDSGTSAPGGYAMELRYSAAQKLALPRADIEYTDIWQASEYTVDALTDWVRSSSFRLEIARQLEDADASALSSLSIAADNARSIGVLYLSHPKEDALRAIGAAAIRVLAERNQSYFPQLGGEAAQVTILDAPAIRSAAPPLTNRLAPAIQLAVALMLGLALALVAELLDPKIHQQKDLRRLGISVLGSIPPERA